MIGFEVYLNGKRLCIAGIDDYGVLSSVLHWVRRKGVQTHDKKPNSIEEELYLDVGGWFSLTESTFNGKSRLFMLETRFGPRFWRLHQWISHTTDKRRIRPES